MTLDDLWDNSSFYEKIVYLLNKKYIAEILRLPFVTFKECWGHLLNASINIDFFIKIGS